MHTCAHTRTGAGIYAASVGGINAHDGAKESVVAIHSSSITDCAAKSEGGGGMYMIAALLTVTDSEFSRNVAVTRGGGIFASMDSRVIVDRWGKV